MQQKPEVADLGRRLEALRLDTQTLKREFIARHAHLVDATRHLGKAIVRVAQPSPTKRQRTENP